MKVLLNSFLILYLELILIRYLPAYIHNLGYFTNFILIASFFGIGLGLILTKIKTNLLLLTPVFLLILACLKFFESKIEIEDQQVIFFTSDALSSISLSPYLVFPIVYILVGVTLACLSQSLGRYFAESKKPILTYLYDILGSIVGILIFFTLSLLNFQPTFWFGLFTVVFFLFLKFQPNFNFLKFSFLMICLISTVVIASLNKHQTFWSPYYKITLIDNGPKVDLYANGIIHQSYSKYGYSGLYSVIYKKIYEKFNPQDILIIGSGTGQDLKAASHFGAKHIDAVEIDPVIFSIGVKNLQENQHKVTFYNDDGRNFLKKGDKKYDMIVFALTDSLIARSRLGQVRLESYLFTLDGFNEARLRLKPDGLFVTYNDYRKDWLVDRLRQMFDKVYGDFEELDFGEQQRVFIGKIADSPALQRGGNNLPTDDWPFFYTQKQQIPPFYLSIIAIILVITLTGLGFMTKIIKSEQPNLKRMITFFLLGTAFSLIETKSIVQLALVFGTTWMVAGLAFLGILMSVFLGCGIYYLVRRYHVRFLDGRLLFIFLLISLLIQYVIPPSSLILGNPILNFFVAIIYFYSAIFFANLIFAKLFFDSTVANLDLASNILGLVFGGVIEYSAIIFGYSALALMALAIYLLAFIFSQKIYLRKFI